jgi:hypothetical protein
LFSGDSNCYEKLHLKHILAFPLELKHIFAFPWCNVLSRDRNPVGAPERDVRVGAFLDLGDFLLRDAEVLRQANLGHDAGARRSSCKVISSAICVDAQFWGMRSIIRAEGVRDC